MTPILPYICLLDYNYDPLTGVFSCKDGSAVSQLSAGYYTVKYDGRTELVHRIIWVMMTEKPIPEGMTVDHIDRNTQNNKWDNFRLITQTGQSLNTRDKVNATGLRGVTYQRDRQLYQATIRYNGKRLNLGRYKTAEEANAVYEAKRKELELQHLC